MSFDLRAVAHAYAAGAEDYAAQFGDEFKSIDFDRALVERLIAGLSRRARVLDIGCGPGQVSAFVESHGTSAVALDLTFEMLAVASRLGAASAYVCGDVRRLPFATASFAVAACWYSLHNLPRDALLEVLCEIRRVTEVDGRLAIGTHSGEGEEWHDTEWNGRHEQVLVTYYAADELRSLVSKAGFSNVAVTTRPPLPDEHQVEKVYVEATVS